MKRRSRPKAVALLVILLALLSIVSNARADDVADEADHLFTLGAEHYQKKDYKEALQYFLASNRLVRNRNVMFNIARTYEHLQQFPDAYRYYQRALEGETDAAVKQRIKESMTRLATSVALLRVETEPPGALVYLNRKDLGDRGTSPQTIPLTPGTYNVIAELAGYEDAASPKLEVPAGTEKKVTLKLVRVVGTLRVLGSGLSVRIDTDDAPIACTSPCDTPVPPGTHVVIFGKAGTKTARATVQVKANAVTEVRPDVEAETGSLVVNADERDATIEIDGKTTGFTPAVLNVAAGKHVVRVTLRGFRPVEQAVEVEANKQTKLDLQLVSSDAVEAASRVAEPVEDAPASVTLVPSPELRAMRYPTVAEAVRGVRGVYVSDDRGYKTLGVRGFGRPGDYGNRVLVLIDGMPTNDNWIWSSYVGYDLRTDIEDVERIEVVRGPGSVLYGTGAFSGVVNLVSNPQEAPDGREVGVSVAEDGVARGRSKITHHFTKDFGVTTSIAAGRSSGRDYFVQEYVPDGPPSIAGNSRGLDGLRSGTINGRIWYKALSAQWFVNHHHKQLPVAQFDTLFGDGRTRQADTRAFLEAKFEPKITDQLTSLSRVHGNYYAYRGKFARTPADGSLEDNEYDGSWMGVEQRFAFTPIKMVRLTGGGEGQYHYLAHQKTANEIDGTILDDKQRFTLFAAYGLVDITPTSNFKASAGARFDAYSTFGASLNPRLAVIVKPWQGGNIKVLAGKAFRAPSIYELYYLAGGGQQSSRDLGPENLYSLEVEVSHRFSRTVIGSAALYSNYITDLIALRDLPGATVDNPAYSYQNTNVPVGSLGGELDLRLRPSSLPSTRASYSFQKSRYLASKSLGDFFSFEQATGLREVPNSPNHLASIRGGVPILSRALMLMTRLTFEGPRFDRNDAEGPDPQRTTPTAFLWDFVFSGSEARWGLSYAVGVYNAFDARWAVPVSSEFRQTTMVQMGRTFLAMGSLTF